MVPIDDVAPATPLIRTISDLSKLEFIAFSLITDISAWVSTKKVLFEFDAEQFKIIKSEYRKFKEKIRYEMDLLAENETILASLIVRFDLVVLDETPIPVVVVVALLRIAHNYFDCHSDCYYCYSCCDCYNYYNDYYHVHDRGDCYNYYDGYYCH